MRSITSDSPSSRETASDRDQNAELDLIDIFMLIVQRKWIVLAFVFVAMLVGGGLSYLMPQRWTSSAVLVPADPQQLRSIDHVLTEMAVLDIKTDITPDTLLSEFMRSFDSRSLREKYLVNTTYFKELAAEKTDDDLQRNRLIDGIIHGNIMSHSSSQDKDSDKKEYRYYEVNYSAENPTDARDLLEGYINYVANTVVEELSERLQYQIEQQKMKEQGQYNLELLHAENQHRIRLDRLQYALDIANAAGLKRPSWSNGVSINDDPDFSVTLGADGLARKLQIEQSLKDVTTLSEKLQNRRLYIEKLNGLKIEPVGNVLPFKYMRSPSEPIKRDSPKRALMVLLFALAGLVAGCGYVLLGSAVARHR